MKLLAPLLLILLALVPVPASGHGGWSHCGASDVVIVGSPDFYVVGSLVYMESNGVAHLQRGGASLTPPWAPDACNEWPLGYPDTLL